MVWYHPSYYKKLREKLKETKMKTFKQHIKEYKGYAGDAKGVNTAGGGEESIEDGSIGVHNIHEPAVLERVNAFVKSIADREYIKPEAALSQLSQRLGTIGLVFKDSVSIEGKSGKFETGLTQHGGRFGKDTDGSDINDDGIQHKLGKELKLKGNYETLENGAVKVYAELA
jgi:hypothetical protein